jgi:hypothetical protein
MLISLLSSILAVVIMDCNLYSDMGRVRQMELGALLMMIIFMLILIVFNLPGDFKIGMLMCLGVIYISIYHMTLGSAL